MSDSETTVQPTGAQRSADADRYEFTSMPWLGILALAATSGEGAAKYGRWNYLRGFSEHDLRNHVFRHLALDAIGDDSEPHLAHAIWGLLACLQERILRPEAHKPHMLGPGMTIPPEMVEHMDAMNPTLKDRRQSGEFAHLANWRPEDLPEVKRLLQRRAEVLAKEGS